MELHAKAALPPGIEPEYPFERASEQVWMLWRRAKSLALKEIEPRPSRT
jgi:hypothetical protein